MDMKEKLQLELQTKRICRFCLSESSNDLTHIFALEGEMNSVPLPMQVISCAFIEINLSDFMPPYACSECRMMFDYWYRFKHMCKQSESIVQQFLNTGELIKPMEKPKIPLEILNKYIEPKDINPLPFPSIVNDQTALQIEGTGTFTRIVQNPQQQQENPEIPKEPKHVTKPQITGPCRQNEKKENSIDSPPDSGNKPKEIHSFPCTSKKVVQNQQQRNRTEIRKEPQLNKSNSIQKLSNKIRVLENLNKTKNRPDPGELPAELFRFPCKNCRKNFLNEQDLQKHNKVHKPVSNETSEPANKTDPKLVCAICEKSFLLREEVDKHVKLHHKHPSFDCPTCSLQFTFKLELEEHIKLHSDKVFLYAHQCNYCDKIFASDKLLNKHKTFHTAFPKYPCNMCPIIYLEKKLLTSHMRSHELSNWQRFSVGISYKCKDCEELFSKREDLLFHMKTHLTVQSLICPICSATYQNSEILNMHLKLHAENLKYVDDKEIREMKKKVAFRSRLLLINTPAQISSVTGNDESKGSPNRRSEEINSSDGNQMANSIIVKEATHRKTQCNEINAEGIEKKDSNNSSVRPVIDFINLVEDSQSDDEPPTKVQKVCEDVQIELVPPLESNTPEPSTSAPATSELVSDAKQIELPKLSKISPKLSLSSISNSVKKQASVDLSVDNSFIPMIIANKKVTVQRITMSKKKAAAMESEGLIQTKGGVKFLRVSGVDSFKKAEQRYSQKSENA